MSQPIDNNRVLRNRAAGAETPDRGMESSDLLGRDPSGDFKASEHLVYEKGDTFIHLGEITGVDGQNIHIAIADTYGSSRARALLNNGEITREGLLKLISSGSVKLANSVYENGIWQYKTVSPLKEPPRGENQVDSLSQAPGAGRTAEIDLAIAKISAEIKELAVERERVGTRLWNPIDQYLKGWFFAEVDASGDIVNSGKNFVDQLIDIDEAPRRRERAEIDQKVAVLNARRTNLEAAREALLAGRPISGMPGTDKEPCLLRIAGEERFSEDNSLEGRMKMQQGVAVRLIDQEEYREALATLLSTAQVYAAVTRDADGNGILTTADGKETLTSRLNDMMVSGSIVHNPPFVLTSTGLRDESFRNAVRAYNREFELARGVLSGRFPSKPIRIEDLDKEAARLAILESENFGAAVQLDETRVFYRRLAVVADAEDLRADAREFWRGTLNILRDPSTVVMIASGMGAGMITRGLLLRLGMVGVRGLGVRTAALAFEGALFHTFNNLGQIALAPGADNPAIKWDVKSFAHSIAMIGWMKGFSGAYGKVAEGAIASMTEMDPVLGKLMFEMGSLTVEGAGFASFDDIWGRYADGQTSEKELHQRFAETMQMVLAFRGMRPLHIKEGATRDHQHLTKLEAELVAAQHKVAEMKGRVANTETFEELRSREAEVVRLELEYLKAKERQVARLFADGKISKGDRKQALQSIGYEREVIGKVARKMGLKVAGLAKVAKSKSDTDVVLEPDKDGFIKLNSFAGVVSSAMRADTSEDQKVGLDRYMEKLSSGEAVGELGWMLRERGVPVRNLRVEDDIYQTSDPNRSVVELTSNGFDAGGPNARVNVTVREGCLEVSDNGTGMDENVIITRLLIPKLSGKPDPSKQLGRFGIGFFTTLRHLKANGDRVTVVTETASGNAHEIVFELRGGEICVRLRRAAATGHSGTKVTIEAKDIRKDAMMAEVDRYLRYADAEKLTVNGETMADVVHLAERRRVAYGDDAEGRVLVREGGSRRGISAMKVGGVVVEQYDSEQGAFSGDVVLEVPSSVGLTITRDQLIVDDKIVSFVEHVITGESDLAVLNSLAPLVSRLDARNDTGKSMLSMLRVRTSVVMSERLSADPTLKIYPSWMHGHIRLSEPVSEVSLPLYKGELEGVDTVKPKIYPPQPSLTKGGSSTETFS